MSAAQAMKLDATLLENVLEFAPDAMLIIDAAGTIVYSNQQAGNLFGLSREQLVDQSVDQLLPQRFRDRHSVHRQRFAANGGMRPMGAGLQLYGQRFDGTEFPVEVSLSPLVGGLTAAAIRDVTDRKKVEAELIAARESANSAREAADRANLAKSRFLATASHDLRQPLQALALMNGILRRMNLKEDAGKAVVEQQRAIDTMKRLLNALLDISKLESGAIKPNPEHFALTSLLDELRNEFAAAAADKKLQLQIEPTPCYVYSDASLVEQLLRNLLSNAIKYTRHGSVRLHAAPHQGRVRIEVADTGIGIAADKLPFIFDEFFQVGVNPNTTREGYGLGLAIVKRISDLLAVKLAVQSSPGKGSVFCLELTEGVAPVEEADALASTEVAARNSDASTVLIVEDDERVRRATRLYLEMENYAVISVGSRDEALQHVYDGDDIDIVVSDYHLEKNETGLDVITSLRAALGRDLPAVLVTGDTSGLAGKLPIDSRLKLASKPIDPEELVLLMQSLLDETRMPATAPDRLP